MVAHPGGALSPAGAAASSSAILPLMDLHDLLGDIDIYLLDQLLKGRIAPGMAVLDAGCGGGRNLVYLLREGYEVCAVDGNPEAVRQVRNLAAHLAPTLPPESFPAAELAAIPFPAGRRELVH